MPSLDTYALVNLSDTKEYLNITGSTYDDILTNTINRATYYLEGYCDRKFAAREYYEWHDGTGQRDIRLKNFPVIHTRLIAYGVGNAFTVSSTDATDLSTTVSINEESCVLTRITSTGTVTTTTLDITAGANDTASKLSATISLTTGFNSTLQNNVPAQWLHRYEGRDVKTTSATFTYPPEAENEYRIDPVEGVVHLRSSPLWMGEYRDYPVDFPNTFQSILVWYKAGYVNIPADIQQACLEVIQKLFTTRDHDPNVSSESLGDYSYSLRESASAIEDVMETLASHRDIR
tara:strand:+ start:394 stop:1263 length:870 start_codon:yes stop_codon:yes gene_type:complete